MNEPNPWAKARSRWNSNASLDEQIDAYPPIPDRLLMGEAWMMCMDCGAKLHSFDGSKDSARHCPYMKNGRCTP